MSINKQVMSINKQVISEIIEKVKSLGNSAANLIELNEELALAFGIDPNSIVASGAGKTEDAEDAAAQVFNFLIKKQAGTLDVIKTIMPLKKLIDTHPKLSSFNTGDVNIGGTNITGSSLAKAKAILEYVNKNNDFILMTNIKAEDKKAIIDSLADLQKLVPIDSVLSA